MDVSMLKLEACLKQALKGFEQKATFFKKY